MAHVFDQGLLKGGGGQQLLPGTQLRHRARGRRPSGGLDGGVEPLPLQHLQQQRCDGDEEPRPAAQAVQRPNTTQPQREVARRRHQADGSGDQLRNGVHERPQVLEDRRNRQPSTKRCEGREEPLSRPQITTTTVRVRGSSTFIQTRVVQKSWARSKMHRCIALDHSCTKRQTSRTARFVAAEQQTPFSCSTLRIRRSRNGL